MAVNFSRYEAGYFNGDILNTTLRQNKEAAPTKAPFIMLHAETFVREKVVFDIVLLSEGFFF